MLFVVLSSREGRVSVVVVVFSGLSLALFVVASIGGGCSSCVKVSCAYALEIGVAIEKANMAASAVLAGRLTFVIKYSL